MVFDRSMTDGGIVAKHVLTSAGCNTLHATLQYPALSLVPLCLLLWFVYRLLHPTLLPGRSRTLTLFLPGEESLHPFAATLSPLSYLRARWALRKYARSQGFRSSKQLVDSMREDEDYDWAGGEKPTRGDFIRSWDRAGIWDGDCIDLLTLESWRSLSDPLSDKALQPTLKKSPTSDSMLQIAQHKIDNVAGRVTPDPALLDFWSAVAARPPRGCGAVSLEWYRDHGLLTTELHDTQAHCDIDETFSNFKSWKRSDAKEEMPTQEELQEEIRVLKRGKEMFYRYGPPILIGLMQVGLSGGFASPRITDVLKATGYLMSANETKDAGRRLRDNLDLMKNIIENSDQKSTLPSQSSSDRTFRRLLETMTFLLDVMEDDDSLDPPSLPPPTSLSSLDGAQLLSKGGRGWLSSCRVRFIHTHIRHRLSPEGNLGTNYPAASGIPINQEDLLATLTSFSIAPLYTLQRMGLSPTQQEREDYVALWRHVGFYMGIEPHLLRRVFRSVTSAERFFSCVAMHHFLAVTKFKYEPSPPAISSRFGLDAEELQRFRFDQGPALPLLYSVARRPPGKMNFSTLCNMSRFLLGDALANAVSLPGMTRRQYLGVRVRLFILAYPPLFARYYPRKQFGVALRENCKGLLRRIIIWSMKGEKVSFETGREHKEKEMMELSVKEGNLLRRQYFQLMTEMLAISCFVGLLALLSLWWMARSSFTALAAIQRTHCTI